MSPGRYSEYATTKSTCSRSRGPSAPRIRRTAGPPRRSPNGCFRCSPTTSTRYIAPATSSRGTRSDLMPIQPDLILAHQFPEIRHAYTARDAILYALGAGLGRDPVAPDDLLFLWEENLAVLPTFAVTLCTPGLWLRAPEFGIDFGKLVHAEQAAIFHAPLPAAAVAVGSARVALLADRGPGRGAVVALEREIRDTVNGTLYCMLRQTLFPRADGGFGCPPAPNPPSIIPERQPDMRAEFAVDPRAALIYRLSGDPNPLHLDPEAARRGGSTANSARMS